MARPRSASSWNSAGAHDVLDADLPDPYTPEIFDAKVATVFDHILTVPSFAA